VVPLHGSMRHMLCTKCRHREDVSAHLETLASGRTIACPVCADAESVRSALSERSRGVGVMKVGVVLYGESHEDAALVGSLTHRDLMGLRPDLLIVAGTSLKVPGTKRLVRELAKVIKPPGKEGSVHTVFLNREWPSPASEWKGVFDVWLRGDCQRFVRCVEEEKEEEERKALERERRREERRLAQATKEEAEVSSGLTPAMTGTSTTTKKKAAKKKITTAATATTATKEKKTTKTERVKPGWTYGPVSPKSVFSDSLDSVDVEGPRALRNRKENNNNSSNTDDDDYRLLPPPANADLSYGAIRRELLAKEELQKMTVTTTTINGFFAASKKKGAGAAAASGKKPKAAA
jgi:hypothetical protein